MTFLRLGLIGNPLGHSLSPQIHGAFLRQFSLPGSYDLRAGADAAALLDQAIEDGFTGLNVTIPHKVAVIKALPALSPEARLVGAVNTIRLKWDEDADDTECGIMGFNTDIAGLSRTLRQAPAKFPGQKAILLGGGGAARACLVAMQRLSMSGCHIVCRNPQRVFSMLKELALSGFDPIFLQEINVLTIDELPGKLDKLADAKLFVNATPLGQTKDELPFWLTPLLSALIRDAFIFDLVYSAGGLTPLIALATKLGFALHGDGREMLVEQARQAFKIWTGLTPSYQVGLEALEKALKSRV